MTAYQGPGDGWALSADELAAVTAAYQVLGRVGRRVADVGRFGNAAGGWPHALDRAHQELGLLLAHLAARALEAGGSAAAVHNAVTVLQELAGQELAGPPACDDEVLARLVAAAQLWGEADSRAVASAGLRGFMEAAELMAGRWGAGS